MYKILLRGATSSSLHTASNPERVKKSRSWRQSDITVHYSKQIITLFYFFVWSTFSNINNYSTSDELYRLKCYNMNTATTQNVYFLSLNIFVQWVFNRRKKVTETGVSVETKFVGFPWAYDLRKLQWALYHSANPPLGFPSFSW